MKIWIHAEPTMSGSFLYALHTEEPEWDKEANMWSTGTAPTLFVCYRGLKLLGVPLPTFEGAELVELDFHARHVTTWVPNDP
jgi:hypothetical protein